MKNQMTKIIAGIVLLASGFVATANEGNREISLKSDNSKSVVLEMSNVKAGTGISLWTKEGQLLYKDEVKGNSFARVFDLGQLEKVEITLELENEGSLEILPIEVSETDAVLKSGEEVIYTKPVVKLSENELKVFYTEGHQCLEMKISDQFGNKVFSNKISKEAQGMKRYDVSDLTKGKYEIQFTADGRSFYHTIIIE